MKILFWKKLSKKNKLYFEVLLGSILILLIPLALSSLQTPKKASAAWFDDNWAYRQTVAISNSGAAQTDFVLRTTINSASLITAGKLQSDCDDIRVTDTGGKLLPYFTSVCNSTGTNVYFKVPTTIAGASTFYIYYGNTSAINNEAAGSAIFTYFNGIESGLVSDWTTNEQSVSAGTSIKDKGTYAVAWVAQGAAWDDLYQTFSASNNWAGQYLDFDIYSDSTVNIAVDPRNSSDTRMNSWKTVSTTADSWVTFSDDLDTNTYVADIKSVLYFTPNDNTNRNVYIDNFRIRKYDPSVTVNSPASEEQGPGPIGYWKFDDGQGTTAQDSSSNGYDGTITSATWQSEDKCISGKCLFFTSATDRVAAGASNNLNITGDATYEAWVRLTAGTFLDNSTNWTLFSNETYQASGMIFRIDGETGKLYYRSNQAAASTASWSSAIAVSNNAWYHLAAVKSGSNIIFYVNGVAVADDGASVTNPVTTANAFTVGSGVGGTQSVRGFMDDAKVYNYARNAAQIRSDFTSRGSVKGASAQIGSSDLGKSLSNGLVGFWKMDESAANSCTGGVNDSCDSSGNGIDGAWSANEAVTTGKFGNGVLFDGTGDKISLGNPSALNISGSITVSTWIKPATTITAEKGFVTKYGSSYSWALRTNSGDKARFTVDNPSGTDYDATGTTSLTSGSWWHLVGVYDTTAQKVRIYLNGTLENEANGPTSISTTSDTAYIGGQNRSGYDFNGTMDDVRVYNRALSGKEVSDLYNWAPEPVGYWNFEEGQGSSVYNLSASPSALTTSTWYGTGQHWKEGKYGKGAYFNGTDDYIQLGTTTIDPIFATAKNWTVGFWGKISSWTDQGGMFSNRYADSEILRFLTTTTTGSVTMQTRDSDSTLVNQTPTGITTNDWHYFALSRTYGGNIVSYVDGKAVVTTADSRTGDFVSESGSHEYFLGRSIFSSDFVTWKYFNGYIDDVKIYDYARTQGQIVADMNGESAGIRSLSAKSPLGYWRFDEGADNTCSGGTNDACNSGNQGSTLDGAGSGFASPATPVSGWQQSGKFGKALAFDGTNDYVSIPSNSALNIRTSGTVSLWAYPSRSTSGVTVLFAKGNADWAHLDYIIFWYSGKFYGSIADGTSSLDYSGPTTAALANNQWYHVVFTWDTTLDKANIYLNGTQVDSKSTTIVPEDSVTGAAIGRDINYNDYFFPGLLDEVKVYNYALTADEVKLDYNRGSSMVLGALSDTSGLTGGVVASNSASAIYCVPGDTSTCSAPVGEWNFDEGQGGTVNDTSGNANNGTWNGTGTAHWKPGKSGWGGNFNGSDDYIDLPDLSAVVGGRSTLTISAWVKPSSISGTDNILWLGENIARLHLSNGVPCTTFRNSDSTTANKCNTGNAVSTTQWTFLVGRYDGTNVELFVNGVSKGTNSLSGNLRDISPDDDYGLIGAGQPWSAFTINNYFDGTIDQVRIYNYARTAAQIAWDYNRGGPIGHWRLDECQGTTINDMTPGATTSATLTATSTVGTCTTASTFWGGSGGTGAGKLNYAPTFNGTGDFINLPYDPLGLNNSSYTISAWVKTSYSGAIQNIFHRANVGNDTSVASQFKILTTGQLNADDYNPSGGGFTGTSTILNNGNWHHAVFIRSGTNRYFYVDGKLDNSQSSTETYSGSDTTNIYIGVDKRGTISQNFFNGQIDDVKIYNYALTASQVRSLYGNGAINFAPSTGAP